MLSLKKNYFYQVMIFLALTVNFCAGNLFLFLIPYSYTCTVPWIRTNILQIYNEENNVKLWEDLNLHPFNLFSMLLPLSYKCLICLRWFQLYTQPRNYTRKICGFILRLSSWDVRVEDCTCEGCRFKSLQNFSCDF